MNPVIQLLQQLGCDLTVIPTNDYELAVLIMKFISALSLVIMFMKMVFTVTRQFLRGRF